MHPVLDRCRSGDREAFGEVVARYGLQVLRTARLIVRDEALAEDVCQETLVNAWRRIRSFRGEDLGPWLMRIATNESISAWRRGHHFNALVDRLAWLPRRIPTASPDHRVDLARALDRLPARLRATVVLHYYHDLSVEATAGALDLHVDTVKSRLKTALRRLRVLTAAQEDS